MIRYNRGSFSLRTLCRIQGSVFKRSLLPALLCAALGALFKHWDVQGSGPLKGVFTDVLTDNSAYSSVSVLIGFLVIFRTQQSYNRFWDGCRYIKEMQAEWFMTGSNLFAFTRAKSNADAAATKAFQDVLVRLLSLLHAVALAQLHGKDSANVKELMREAHQLGLDEQTHVTIKSHDCKVELLVQLLQALTVDAQTSGVLTIAPPILSRIFQNLSNGLSAFYSAYRITEVPYPFPYMQATELLLLGHCVVTPLAMCSFTAKPIWSGVFCFLVAIILISLNQIAVELEDPYGTDVNDLNLSEMQQEMNKRLKMLHKHASHATPSMKHGESNRSRSMIMDTFTTFSEQSRNHDATFFKLISAEDLRNSTIQGVQSIAAFTGHRTKSSSSTKLNVPPPDVPANNNTNNNNDNESRVSSPRSPVSVSSPKRQASMSQVSFSDLADVGSETSFVKASHNSHSALSRPKGGKVILDDVAQSKDAENGGILDTEEVACEVSMSKLRLPPRTLPHLARLAQQPRTAEPLVIGEGDRIRSTDSADSGSGSGGGAGFSSLGNAADWIPSTSSSGGYPGAPRGLGPADLGPGPGRIAGSISHQGSVDRGSRARGSGTTLDSTDAVDAVTSRLSGPEPYEEPARLASTYNTMSLTPNAGSNLISSAV